MIDLRINNQSLDLYPDTSISMEENSSVFSSDVMPGSFSMPFTIPASANNSRLLGFPEMLNLKEKPKLRYPAELIVEGVPSLSGEIIFRGFADDKYKINFQSSLSLINQYFQDTKLRDLPHQPFVILDPTSTATSIAKKHVDIWLEKAKKPDPVQFSLNGNNIEGTDTSWQYDLINQVAELGLGIKLEITEDSTNFKFLFSLLDGYSYDTPIEVEFSDDEEDPAFSLNYIWHSGYAPLVQASIKTFENNNLSNSDFVFPTVRNPSFYGDQEGSFATDFNDYADDRDFIFNLGDGKRSSFIPMYSLDYVFRKIKEATGVEIIGDFVDHPDIQKLIFFNSFSLDMFENSYPGQPSHAYHYRIDPANHLPDMTINELLLELGKMFSLGFDFNHDAMTLELFFRKPVVESDAFKDITDRTNPRYELNLGENEGFRIGYRWDTKDLAYDSTNPAEMAPVVVGNGKNTVDLKLFTTYMRKNLVIKPTGGGPFSYKWHGVKVPFVNLPGAWGRKDAPSDPRLLFFYGWAKNYDNEDYAFASADNYDFYGDPVGDLSLIPQHLYDSVLKPWYDFLMIDQQVDREGYWSIIDLLNHNEKQKYRIDQIRYLIKRISYSVSTRRGLGPVKLEMLKAE